MNPLPVAWWGGESRPGPTAGTRNIPLPCLRCVLRRHPVDTERRPSEQIVPVEWWAEAVRVQGCSKTGRARSGRWPGPSRTGACGGCALFRHSMQLWNLTINHAREMDWEATVLGDGVAVRSLPSWLDSGARANERHHLEVVQNWQGALKLSKIVGRCSIRPVRRKPEAGDGTL